MAPQLGTTLALLTLLLQGCGGRSADGGDSAGHAGAGASGAGGAMPSAPGGTGDTAGAPSAGAGGGSSPPYFNGSCNLPAESACDAYYFQTDDMTRDNQSRCSANAGMWSADTECPVGGKFASCTRVEGLPITTINYYDADVAAAAKQACFGNWRE